MRILVVGATGGTGRAAVEALVAKGHDVTALVRQSSPASPLPHGVRLVTGDATNASDVDRAVQGQDAVVVALGIRENAMRVRLFGSARTPMNVRSLGTGHVIDAMRRHGVPKLVVQTSYGVGSSRTRLSFKWRAIFSLLLAPQIADTETQERLVCQSDLAWVVAQPVALTDAADTRAPHTSTTGDVRSMAVSRRQVAAFLAEAVEISAYDRRVVAVS